MFKKSNDNKITHNALNLFLINSFSGSVNVAGNSLRAKLLHFLSFLILPSLSFLHILIHSPKVFPLGKIIKLTLFFLHKPSINYLYYYPSQSQSSAKIQNSAFCIYYPIT